MNKAELYARIKARGGIADLSSRAQLHLSGKDRVRYLNGQVSNDVRKSNPGEAMAACVMTAKGKMCANIFIAAGKNVLRVDADPSLRESLRARLERYIISDDVTLEDVTERTKIIHRILPPGSHVKISGEPEFQAVESNRFGLHGIDLVVSTEKFSETWKNLASRFPIIDNEMLETLRVEAGIPRWGFELNEETIPVEAGLDKTAIDYHKGCYIGQEIISRLKSAGHVNRQLRGFVSPDGTLLQTEMRLFAPENPGRETGRLTSAAYSFGLEKPVALGYVKRDTVAGVLNVRAANVAGEEIVCAVLVKELPLIP